MYEYTKFMIFKCLLILVIDFIIQTICFVYMNGCLCKENKKCFFLKTIINLRHVIHNVIKPSLAPHSEQK